MAFREAQALGVVQVHLTGGEPLLRDDLEELVAGAKKLELYTTLITSGIPLTRQRLARLRDFGLDGVQLSFQGPTAESSDLLAGSETFESKLDVARWAKDLRLPLTVNVVMHRRNLDRTAEVIELAERLRADRLELANVQYIGWALLNRRALLPTREQLEQARATAGEAKERLRGRMEVIFVLADYYADVPKTCMDGWGRRYIVVTPDGLVGRAMQPTRCQAPSQVMLPTGRCHISGKHRNSFNSFEETVGCRRLAEPATVERSISAGAGAKPIG